VWPDGTTLEIKDRGGRLDITLKARPGIALRGLLGDRNGKADDDFRLRDGTVLAKPLDAQKWKDFAAAWRINAAESLFTYGPSQSTTTFTDLAFPGGPATSGQLAAGAYGAARATCLAAGVTDEALLEACIVDVGTTGDGSFAASSAGIPSPAESPPAIYDLAVDPTSLTVDRVSQFTLVPSTIKDGVFTATVRGPVTALSLIATTAAGTPAGGQVWDTVTSGNTWVLGVEENGAFLNAADGSLPPLDGGLHRLRLLVESTAAVTDGQHFKLLGAVAGGAQIGSPVMAYQRPLPLASCPSAAAHWMFEEGTGATAADPTGHGHTLTLTSTSWTSGRHGAGLGFDGGRSYAAAPYDAGFQATRQLTVAAWIRPGAVGSAFRTLVA